MSGEEPEEEWTRKDAESFAARLAECGTSVAERRNFLKDMIQINEKTPTFFTNDAACSLLHCMNHVKAFTRNPLPLLSPPPPHPPLLLLLLLLRELSWRRKEDGGEKWRDQTTAAQKGRRKTTTPPRLRSSLLATALPDACPIFPKPAGRQQQGLGSPQRRPHLCEIFSRFFLPAHTGGQ